MKISSLFAGLSVAAALVAAPAGAVTIVNGGFEAASLNPGVFTTLFAGSTAINGWTVGGHSIDYIGSYWQPAEGSRSIDLSGNDKGAISQLLSGLTVGYQLTQSISVVHRDVVAIFFKLSFRQQACFHALRQRDFLLGSEQGDASSFLQIEADHIIGVERLLIAHILSEVVIDFQKREFIFVFFW